MLRLVIITGLAAAACGTACVGPWKPLHHPDDPAHAVSVTPPAPTPGPPSPPGSPYRTLIDPGPVPRRPPRAVPEMLPEPIRPSPPPVLKPAEPPPPDVLRALGHYLEHRPDDALDLIERRDRPTQEVLLRLLPVVAELGGEDSGPMTPSRAERLLDQLEAARGVLTPAAPLRIAKAALTTSVKGFGLYDPVPAGRPLRPRQRVWLYLEVKNAVNEPVAGGLYRTRLAIRVRVCGPGGKAVWPPPSPNGKSAADVRTERTRSPRHDLPFVYHIPVPRLTPGRYSLEVTLIDMPTGRSAAAKVPFRLAAGGRNLY